MYGNAMQCILMCLYKLTQPLRRSIFKNDAIEQRLINEKQSDTNVS